MRELLPKHFSALSRPTNFRRDESTLSADCAFFASMIAPINPGNRSCNSIQRDVLCISTPRRSPRINPASRNTLKCCDSVDLGIAFSLTFKKFEHVREHSDDTICT